MSGKSENSPADDELRTIAEDRQETGQQPTSPADRAKSLEEESTIPYVQAEIESEATTPIAEHRPHPILAKLLGMQPGQRLGDYELIKEISRGGMGVVYLAQQFSLNRRVAIKFILPEAGIGKAQLARFRREAQAVARLSHPHVVQIFEIGEVASLPFFAMEYVAGGDLGTLADQSPLAPRHAAELVEILARTMHQVHEAGIIHRDLKPANILVTESGDPKISDFGLARDFQDQGERLTPSEAILGTPSYMAPEQAAGSGPRGSEIGPGSDVYSLGAVLYKLLTRKAPFGGGTVWETVQQVVSKDPVLPRQLEPAIPRDLETICLKCLEKEPRRRYSSAFELAEDLRKFLEGKPVVARPIGRAERTWKWARRHPASTISSGMAVVACLAILGVMLSYRGKIAQQRSAFQEKLLDERKQTDAFAVQSFLAASEWVRSASIDGVFGDPNLLGAERKKALQEALDQLLRMLPQYEARANQHPDEPAYRALLASAYFQIGMLRMTLGLADAESPTREALAYFEELSELNPNDLEIKQGIAYCHFNLGQLFTRQPLFSDAIQQFDLAQRVAESLPEGLVPDDLRLRIQLGKAFSLANAGQLAAAKDVLRDLLPAIDAIQANPRSTPNQRAHAGRALYSLGLVAVKQGQYLDAKAYYARAREIQQQLVESYGANHQFRRDFMHTLTNYGQILWQLRETGQVEELFQESYDHGIRLSEQVPIAGTDSDFDLGLAGYHLSSFLFSKEELASAQTYLEQSVPRLRRAYARKPANTRFREIALEASVGWIRVLLERGDHERAVTALRDSIELVPAEPNQFVDAARFVILAMSLASQDSKLEEATRDVQLQDYGGLAVQLLEDAVELGVNPTALEQDSTLAAIHNRPDFQSLVAQKTPGEPTAAPKENHGEAQEQLRRH